MHYQDLGWFDHPDLEDKELKRWEKNFDWLKRLNSKYKYSKER